jgi:hypothetical protein
MMTATRTRQRISVSTALCLGVALFVGLGVLPMLAQAGESAIEFVGNLISNVHHISLDRLDPTCPQCF